MGYSGDRSIRVKQLNVFFSAIKSYKYNLELYSLVPNGGGGGVGSRYSSDLYLVNLSGIVPWARRVKSCDCLLDKSVFNKLHLPKISSLAVVSQQQNFQACGAACN